MGTRSADQQRKQRQKEFKEKKEHQERLLALKKANREAPKTNDAPDELGKTEA